MASIRNIKFLKILINLRFQNLFFLIYGLSELNVIKLNHNLSY